jgi:hypothetical protein
MLRWLVNERAIELHIPVFDKSARDDGRFSRGDFAYNQEADIYLCPAGEKCTQIAEFSTLRMADRPPPSFLHARRAAQPPP